MWEFSKERNDVFGTVGDAVLVTKALVMVSNALLDLVCLSELCLLPLPQPCLPGF